MKYSIHNITEKRDLLPDVISLGDSQKKTLGFLPENAFEDYAARGNIIVAVSESNEVLGYVLFAQKQNLVCRLAHVCVRPDARRQGIAEELISHLKQHTSHMNRITVRCRRDYGIDVFWEKNGFIARAETAGRGSKETTLTIWELALQPTLLSLMPDSVKIFVVLDLNVLIAAKLENDIVSESLLTFTYSDEIDYRISRYSFNEVNRSSDKIKRQHTRDLLNSFSVVDKCQNHELTESVVAIVGEKHRYDANQIASAIYNRAYSFITNDTKIISHSDEIARKFGIHLYTPTEFVVNYCNDQGKDLYYPAYLPQSEIQFRPIGEYRHSNLFRKYKASGERKHEFKAKTTINPALISEYSLLRICIDGDEVGILISSMKGQQLVIQFLRLKQFANHLHTISIHIIEKILLNAVEMGATEIVVTDNDCGELVVSALLKAAFQQTNKGLVKPVEKGLITPQQAFNRLGINAVDDEMLSAQSLFAVERILWPAKIQGLDIPTYIVPIQPQWAKQLITAKDFQGLLFGTPEHILQTRRVYYRHSKGTMINQPARIVWYVSQNKHPGPNKCAVGISLIDEVDIAPVKNLFPRYERFGVYSWKNILETAGGDPHKEMMAISFSKTEVFKTPVPLKKLAEIIAESEVRKLLTVSPYRIESKTFEMIYQLGFRDVR
ncbi:N-acetyltransferase [Desulfovibrio desulfuricans]|uniref:N-acetyltransferase n=1 Tax=Desulfovibrio desulfuricans TaxID=876 RepID=A0A4P7UFG1_DESDE|nr:GNAT family N-acetyltransferase [Desulfovibrio desulfuricans]QCC84673.1 N-acetyltransferase [Desulfovibrio desulfuricans]